MLSIIRSCKPGIIQVDVYVLVGFIQIGGKRSSPNTEQQDNY